MKKSSVVVLLKESYLAVIRNAVGTQMFRTFYALVDGKKRDIMRRGDLSCAFFVSFILTGFSLIKSMHGTVDGTVKDLESSGWTRIKTPKKGCIIVWEPLIDEKGESHKHIGFYIGADKAISNSSIKKSPRVHSYHIRKVCALYWNAKLN